ncbi:unnamed protein product [Orchesella dallaii]|uniref:C2H2-type domain-containing protein n=1 Tax=Orchesella dallaii TaxID=48710 RepID=A0ABP1R339_9HEXA
MDSDTGEGFTEANLSSDDESFKEMEIEGEMFDLSNEVNISQSATALDGGITYQQKLKIKKLQSEIKQKPGIWRCPSCSLGFPEPEQYVLHEVKEHGENQIMEMSISAQDVSPKKIGTLHSDPGNLRGHLNPPKNKLKSAYKCDTCSVTFHDSTKFFYHMLQVHGRVFRIRKTEETNEDKHENQNICPESTCNFRGCSKLQLLEHVKQHLDQVLQIAKADSFKTTSANIDLHLTTEKDKVSTVSLENLSREVIPADDVGTAECNLEQSFGACPKITGTSSLADIVSPSPTFLATSSSSTSSSSITSFANTTREMVYHLIKIQRKSGHENPSPITEY